MKKMKNKIESTKASEIKRSWHLVDVKDKVLGRVASEISGLLIGKSKPYYVSYLDCGDYVVVINAAKVKTTGRKEVQKKYYAYSGYPGGLKTTLLKDLRKTHPERIIEFAVKNMLPKNKLQNLMMRRLKVFAGEEHSYTDKLEVKSQKLKV